MTRDDLQTQTGSGSSPDGEPPHEPAPQGPPRGAHVMAIVRWILVAAMAVIAALSVAHSFGLFSSEPASAASGRYYCPMHPQVVRDHPGECPICSMTLVEREGSNAQATSHERHRHEPSDPPVTTPAMPDMPADHDAPAPRGVPGLAPVELSFERVQKIGVRTASATLEALLPELSAVGIVSADEARLARVHTRFSGWIEQLAVPVTGQKVKRGQVLAGLYSPELLPAQQEFLAARRWSTSPTAARGASPATGSSLEQDARARLELFGLSPAEIDRIALTGKPTRTVSVTAPISGHVVSTNAVLGAYVRPGTQLFEIADLTQLWVLADVYEHEAPRVSVGQVADVRFAAYPSKLFSGKVGFIYPTIDAATRTLRVRISLDNAGLELRPGMYGDVVIHLDVARGVVIPTEGLVDTGEHQYVFVVKGGGRFEPRRVQAGARRGDDVQILEGLSPGEVVVTTANFMIDSESRLRAAIQGTSGR